jgi:hypothetical protein
MKDILIQFALPTITALLSYFGSVYKNKVELEKTKKFQNVELQKLKEMHKNELNKISLDIEMYKNKKETDTMNFFYMEFIQNPDKFIENLSKIENYSNNANKKRRR